MDIHKLLHDLKTLSIQAGLVMAGSGLTFLETDLTGMDLPVGVSLMAAGLIDFLRGRIAAASKAADPE